MKNVREILGAAWVEAQRGNSTLCKERITEARVILKKGYAYEEDISHLSHHYKGVYEFPKKNKNPNATPVQQPCIVNKYYNFSGIDLTTALFIVFLVLKLSGVIDWGWWWIVSPIWGLLALYALKNITKKRSFNKQLKR